MNCGERRIVQCALIMHSYRFFFMFPFFPLFHCISRGCLHSLYFSSSTKTNIKALVLMKIVNLWRPTDPFLTAVLSLSRRPLCHKLMIKQYKTHTGAGIYIIHTASIISFVAAWNGNKIRRKENISDENHLLLGLFILSRIRMCVLWRLLALGKRITITATKPNTNKENTKSKRRSRWTRKKRKTHFVNAKKNF